MNKLIVSRHPIASGGRHRVQKGSIVLVLECRHAVLGTQSEHGDAKRAHCSMCESPQRVATQQKIAILEAQLQKLKREWQSATEFVSHHRQNRKELRGRLLEAMRTGSATASELANAVNSDSEVVGKTLYNMMKHGHCVQIGKSSEGLNLWALKEGAQ